MMKLAAYTLSALLFVLGLLEGGGKFAISGAVLFLVIELLALISDYRAAKEFREGIWEPKEKTTLGTMTDWVRGIVLYGGTVLSVIQKRDEPVFILWVGIIGCWFLAGVIAQIVGGVPLRMTYGGWKVDRRRRRGRRY
jgi:hypothetical protein